MRGLDIDGLWHARFYRNALLKRIPASIIEALASRSEARVLCEFELLLEVILGLKATLTAQDVELDELRPTLTSLGEEVTELRALAAEQGDEIERLRNLA